MINLYVHHSRAFEGEWTGAAYIEVDNTAGTITAVWSDGTRLPCDIVTMSLAQQWIDSGSWVPFKPKMKIFPFA